MYRARVKIVLGAPFASGLLTNPDNPGVVIIMALLIEKYVQVLLNFKGVAKTSTFRCWQRPYNFHYFILQCIPFYEVPEQHRKLRETLKTLILRSFKSFG